MAQEGLSFDIVKSATAEPAMSEPAMPVPTEPVKDTFIEYPLGVNGKKVYFYKTDNVPVTREEFWSARSQYLKDGSTPPNFTALDDRSLAQIARSGFEKFNQPLQRGAKALSGMIASGASEMQENVGPLNPIKYMPDVSSAIPRVAAESIDTPEKFASTAALTASGLGLLGKGLAKTSGIMPTLKRAAVAGAASYGATAGTGTDATLPEHAEIWRKASSQAIVTAVTVAATEGIVGVLTKGVGAIANKQAGDDLYNVMTKEYPGLTYSGVKGLDEYASSKANLEKLVQRRIKSIKGEGDNAALQFAQDIGSALPGGFTPETKRFLEPKINQYRDMMDGLLDSIDDPSKVRALFNKASEVKDEIIKRIAADFKEQYPNLSQKAFESHLMKLQDIMEQYARQEMKFVGGAEVIAALRNHNPGKGFNLQKFQDYMKHRLYSGGSLLEDASLAASRGVPGGVDRQTRMTFDRVPEWLLNKIGLPIASIPVGSTKYVGEVKGLTRIVPIDIATKDAVDRFMKRKEEK